MEPSNTNKARPYEEKFFLGFLIAVSLAFALILWPFYAAVFWAGVLAILFAPLFRRLARSMRNRRTLAALATLLIVLFIVILPTALLAAQLVQQGMAVYARVQSGEFSLAVFFEKIQAVIPAWATGLLDRFGLTDFSAVQERFSAGFGKGVQFVATNALSVGQNTFEFIVGLFIMLYLLFFLLRDGDELSRRISRAIPLNPELQHNLAQKFTVVARATVKGNIVVAIIQGALGGFIFWLLGVHGALLWAVVMAFLSLLPAVGTALVWGPVALYFLATGSLWEGIGLIAYGVLVIGLVDNVLRPILVGKDTKLPDYVVLISTLGGLAIFGLNGFVIGPLIAAIFITGWDIFSTSRPDAGPRPSDR